MKLYTKNNCSACEGAKSYLDSHDVAYTIVNIEEDYDAAVELVKAGYRSVPVLKTDSTYLVGSAQIKTIV